MDESRINAIVERVAGQHTAGRLQLGPRKKTMGGNTMSWYQDFKFDPEGWELKDLMKKVIRYLKKPPANKLRGYSGPTWFIQFKTNRGMWSVKEWGRRTTQTYEKLVEDGKLIGKGIGGWSFKEE